MNANVNSNAATSLLVIDKIELAPVLVRTNLVDFGAQPTEAEDDPAVLTKLAYQLVQDDACLVLAELIAHNGGKDIKALERPAAQVLLQMATTPEAPPQAASRWSPG